MYLLKSHVKQHTRKTPSGGLAVVKEHDDKRFEARSLKGTKWHNPQGHTRGEGHGVYDHEKKAFLADKGKSHPWDYKKPGTAREIAADLNGKGPAAELHYGREHAAPVPEAETPAREFKMKAADVDLGTIKRRYVESHLLGDVTFHIDNGAKIVARQEKKFLHVVIHFPNGKWKKYIENSKGTFTEAEASHNHVQFQKSHVKQHTRTSKTGTVSMVQDYDDKRSKRETESRQSNIPTQLQDLPPSLREKCRRAEPGKGHEITLLKIEAAYLLKKGVFGLISAGRNPASTLDRHLTDKEIEHRYQDLQNDLKGKGLKWVKVRGNYDGEEDSMMVLNPDIHREELVELGTKFNQDSVIFTDHGKNELIYTTGQHKGERNEGSGFKETPDADNYYTDLKTAKGHIKFSLNFDFDKFVKALKLGLYIFHINR
jgi:hypothetical protein